MVFLDIQMPGGSGFDLLARLDHVPRVIFTTAYDQYAVKAFDVNALDYLLKPIEPRGSRPRCASCRARRRCPAARRGPTPRSSSCSCATGSAAGSCRCAR